MRRSDRRALAEAPARRLPRSGAHDRAVAAISHLPYAVAVALVNAVIAGNEPLAWALAASGFRDTSRVAASDVDMMLDILLTNRHACSNGSATTRCASSAGCSRRSLAEEEALAAPPAQPGAADPLTDEVLSTCPI
jgi:prephenate dehydrogenase